MKKILGMGNALTDMLFQLNDDALLEKLNLVKGGMQLIENAQSEEIKSHLTNSTVTMARGGSASNTVNGVAKLGLESGFIGKVSNDSIGKFFTDNSIENGVTPHLTSSDTPSGHCTVLVSADNERTMCTYLGAASELLSEDLSIDMFRRYDFFHIEGYLVQNHDLIRTALKLAKEAGLTTSIDLASFNVVQDNLEFLHEITNEYVDITFANEEEAYEFTGKQPREAVAEIARMCSIAVVKIGKKGSYVQSGNEIHVIEPFLANGIDTTGAGDFYAAGFLYGYAKGFPLEVCGRIGSYVSSKVVEVIGTKMSNDTWIEIAEKIREIAS